MSGQPLGGQAGGSGRPDLPAGLVEELQEAVSRGQHVEAAQQMCSSVPGFSKRPAAACRLLHTTYFCGAILRTQGLLDYAASIQAGIIQDVPKELLQGQRRGMHARLWVGG